MVTVCTGALPVLVNVTGPRDDGACTLADGAKGVLEARSCFLTAPPLVFPLTLLLPSPIRIIGGAITEQSRAEGMCDTSLRVMSEIVQSSWSGIVVTNMRTQRIISRYFGGCGAGLLLDHSLNRHRLGRWLYWRRLWRLLHSSLRDVNV